MITLFTGSPGAGKTYSAMAYLIKELPKLKKAGRPIFTNIDMTPEFMKEHDITHLFDLFGPNEDYNPDIPDRRLFDGSRIETLPDFSYVIIDEIHLVYPTRSGGSKMPPHIKFFSTHRSRGHDYLIISQGPDFIDFGFQNLIDEHRHFSNAFGRGKSTEFRYPSFNKYPRGSFTPSDALRRTVKINDQKVFDSYTSTVLVTTKDTFPYGKVVGASVLLVASLSLAVWGVKYALFNDRVASNHASSSIQTIVRNDCAAILQVAGERLVLRLPDGTVRFSGSTYRLTGRGAPLAIGSSPSDAEPVLRGPGGLVPLCPPARSSVDGQLPA